MLWSQNILQPNKKYITPANTKNSTHIGFMVKLIKFVVKNNCKMSDCSSPVKRTLTSTHAHAFTLNTNAPYLLPSNVRPPKKRKKHWNFLNYEASIDQQFLTEIEHLIARLKVN